MRASKVSEVGNVSHIEDHKGLHTYSHVRPCRNEVELRLRKLSLLVF